jgi:hypothetical protein
MSYSPPEVVAKPGVIIDSFAKTVRPAVPEGDDYFGLSIGTNGTAAACRRAVVEAVQQIVNGRLTWLRSNGQSATGLTLVPSARSDAYEANPWSGQ